ncbi:hypothetical protein QS306_11770 [Paraburkholderia bonniea]|uniref:hypothetical protein n=1 Tax=Paraburkholderia bonniea TaxID=2152891 RepID=UPI001580100D|nr:hypothetical protein [Paraburkholderia bonniea]WJF89772.1 hypothetical protein QS306_11770 [Paraburkholderia bonniea]WJF93086.1 hypothetical protein QS308_11780 [Paraburkholderia bonniea]
MKLTFAISLVALVLIATTTTICLSGAISKNASEYDEIHAALENPVNPLQLACR